MPDTAASVGNIIKNTIDYRDKQLTPIDYRKQMTTDYANSIIDDAIDLISNQDFRPYFFKTLYIIGPTAFIESMQIARKSEANCQPCIFVKRLKELRGSK